MPTDKVVDGPRWTSGLYPQLAPGQLVEFDPLPRFDSKVRQQIPSQRDLPFHCDGKGSHGKSPISNQYKSNGIFPYIQGSSDGDFAFTLPSLGLALSTILLVAVLILYAVYNRIVGIDRLRIG
jgi:hypothetical protein